MRIPEVSLWN